jgi:hypothetical protein
MRFSALRTLPLVARSGQRGVALAAVLLGLAACSGDPGPSVAEIAKRPALTDPKTLSSRVLSEADLPPEGTRSLFDHLVAEAGGVPYPFEKLVAVLQKLDANRAKPLALLIPDGRSLLKAQANAAHPRIVAATDFQSASDAAKLGITPRGQLFLGFTELANEIEVISYNEAAGRFEFQLVQDYRARGARRLVYAKRAVCQSCHQGGAPIFSVRPWGETNAQPAVQARIQAAIRKDEYLGFPVAVPLSIPERYDELTDIGNFIATTQKLWLDGCGPAARAASAAQVQLAASCRRQQLAQALEVARAPGDFQAQAAGANTLRKLQAAAGGHTVAEPPSDLANRDPIAERQGLKGWWRQLWTPTVKLGDGAKTNEELEAFDRLPKLPAAQDPLSPRPPKRSLGPQDIDAVYGLASLITASDIALLTEAYGNWPAVQAAVAALPDAQFAAKPFVRVQLLQALLAAAPQTISPAYAYLDVSELSPPVATGEPPVTLAANSPLLPYRDYCFACHRDNPSKRLNFLSGATEAAVLANLKAKGEVRDVLDWARYQGTDKAHTLMPPADTIQKVELQAALKKDPELLEKMRAVVPGLFDF